MGVYFLNMRFTSAPLANSRQSASAKDEENINKTKGAGLRLIGTANPAVSLLFFSNS